MVPFFSLTGRTAETGWLVQREWTRVLASGTYVGGAPVDGFCRSWAHYLGAGHAVGVGNGLDALRLALQALGTRRGDEVIVPALTFVATALAVQQLGAVPVLVDVDEHGSIEPSAVPAAIGPKTTAIIAVHLWGRPAAVDVLRRLADRHQLALVEDAAQAHGATLGGRKVGTFGDAAAFSFYPTKNLGGVGDGGAVVTDCLHLAQQVTALGNYGAFGSDKYQHWLPGTNSRLDPVQAAALSVFLPLLDGWNARRRVVAERYGQALTGSAIIAPQPCEGHVWHHYVVRSPERDRLRQRLAARGIGTDVHYPVPLTRTPAITAQWGNCRQAEQLARTVVSLPMHPWLTEHDLDFICTALTDLGG